MIDKKHAQRGDRQEGVAIGEDLKRTVVMKRLRIVADVSRVDQPLHVSSHLTLRLQCLLHLLNRIIRRHLKRVLLASGSFDGNSDFLVHLSKIGLLARET